MEKEKLCLIELDNQKVTASCHICYARNYDPVHPSAVGEKVDRLYKLGLGYTRIVLCDNCLDRLSDMLNTARRRDCSFCTGDEVWIVERAAGEPVQVCGFKYIASVADFFIVTPVFSWCKGLQEIMAHHASETVSNGDSYLAVFPMKDCYATREAALAALHEEKGEDDDPES